MSEKESSETSKFQTSNFEYDELSSKETLESIGKRKEKLSHTELLLGNVRVVKEESLESAKIIRETTVIEKGLDLPTGFQPFSNLYLHDGRNTGSYEDKQCNVHFSGESIVKGTSCNNTPMQINNCTKTENISDEQERSMHSDNQNQQGTRFIPVVMETSNQCYEKHTLHEEGDLIDKLSENFDNNINKKQTLKGGQTMYNHNTQKVSILTIVIIYITDINSLKQYVQLTYFTFFSKFIVKHFWRMAVQE